MQTLHVVHTTTPTCSRLLSRVHHTQIIPHHLACSLALVLYTSYKRKGLPTPTLLLVAKAWHSPRCHAARAADMPSPLGSLCLVVVATFKKTTTNNTSQTKPNKDKHKSKVSKETTVPTVRCGQGSATWVVLKAMKSNAHHSIHRVCVDDMAIVPSGSK